MHYRFDSGLHLNRLCVNGEVPAYGEQSKLIVGLALGNRTESFKAKVIMMMDEETKNILKGIDKTLSFIY